MIFFNQKKAMVFPKLSALERLHVSDIARFEFPKADLINSLDSAVKPLFQQINFRVVDQKIHVTPDLSVHSFNQMLKRGEFSKAFSLIDPKIKLSSAQMRVFDNRVRLYPDYHLAKHEKYLQSFRQKMPDLDRVQNDRAFVDLAKSNAQLGATLDQLADVLKKRNGTVRGFTYTFVVPIALIGIGGAGLYRYIETYRQMMSGCLCYRYINNEIVTCKVVSHSCRNGAAGLDLTGHYPVCDEAILPDYIRKDNCQTSGWIERPEDVGTNKRSGCYNCNLDVRLDPRNTEEHFEHMKLVCKEEVSFVEALGDIVSNLPETIVAVAKTIWSYLRYIIIIVVVIVISYGFYYVNRVLKNIGVLAE